MRMMLAALLLATGISGSALAQQAPPSPPYGSAITLAGARRVVQAAIADVERQNFPPMAVAVVDWAGHLVASERVDSTQTASLTIAIEKARSAAGYRRPTKAFEDVLAGGRTAILALPGVLPSEGGVPIVREGWIVGVIGVSGGTAQQDGVIAAAGIAALR
jgi:glc operon protein GlcG